MNIRKIFHKFISVWLLVSFAFCGAFPANVCAQMVGQSTAVLPPLGVFVNPTSPVAPAVLRGITVDVDHPFTFDFILDQGESVLSVDELEHESQRLIKYFLASLAIPEEDLWVNLAPREQDRIIPDAFGQTIMGRDLLAQDYLLKQLTASLLCPETELGRVFWDKIYAEAYNRYGTTDVPLDALSRVWIVPEEATIHVEDQSAFIVGSRLKVLLEGEYLAASRNNPALASEMIKKIIIPALEREVNEGAHFVKLRQIYHSLILAAWYKKHLQASLLARSYADQQIVHGVDIDDKEEKLKIYQQYLKSFQNGLFNEIQEEYDPQTQEMVVRKYVAGGARLNVTLNEVSDFSMATRAAQGPLHHIQGAYSQVFPSSVRKKDEIRLTAELSLDEVQEITALPLNAFLGPRTKDALNRYAQKKKGQLIFLEPFDGTFQDLHQHLLSLKEQNQFSDTDIIAIKMTERERNKTTVRMMLGQAVYLLDLIEQSDQDYTSYGTWSQFDYFVEIDISSKECRLNLLKIDIPETGKGNGLGDEFLTQLKYCMRKIIPGKLIIVDEIINWSLADLYFKHFRSELESLFYSGEEIHLTRQSSSVFEQKVQEIQGKAKMQLIVGKFVEHFVLGGESSNIDFLRAVNAQMGKGLLTMVHDPVFSDLISLVEIAKDFVPPEMIRQLVTIKDGDQSLLFKFEKKCFDAWKKERNRGVSLVSLVPERSQEEILPARKRGDLEWEKDLISLVDKGPEEVEGTEDFSMATQSIKVGSWFRHIDDPSRIVRIDSGADGYSSLTGNPMLYITRYRMIDEQTIEKTWSSELVYKRELDEFYERVAPVNVKFEQLLFQDNAFFFDYEKTMLLKSRQFPELGTGEVIALSKKTGEEYMSVFFGAPNKTVFFSDSEKLAQFDFVQIVSEDGIYWDKSRAFYRSQKDFERPHEGRPTFADEYKLGRFKYSEVIDGGTKIVQKSIPRILKEKEGLDIVGLIREEIKAVEARAVQEILQSLEKQSINPIETIEDLNRVVKFIYPQMQAYLDEIKKLGQVFYLYNRDLRGFMTLHRVNHPEGAMCYYSRQILQQTFQQLQSDLPLNEDHYVPDLIGHYYLTTLIQGIEYAIDLTPGQFFKKYEGAFVVMPHDVYWRELSAVTKYLQTQQYQDQALLKWQRYRKSFDQAHDKMQKEITTLLMKALPDEGQEIAEDFSMAVQDFAPGDWFRDKEDPSVWVRVDNLDPFMGVVTVSFFELKDAQTIRSEAFDNVYPLDRFFDRYEKVPDDEVIFENVQFAENDHVLYFREGMHIRSQKFPELGTGIIVGQNFDTLDGLELYFPDVDQSIFMKTKTLAEYDFMQAVSEQGVYFDGGAYYYRSQKDYASDSQRFYSREESHDFKHIDLNDLMQNSLNILRDRGEKYGADWMVTEFIPMLWEDIQSMFDSATDFIAYEMLHQAGSGMESEESFRLFLEAIYPKLMEGVRRVRYLTLAYSLVSRDFLGFQQQSRIDVDSCGMCKFASEVLFRAGEKAGIDWDARLEIAGVENLQHQFVSVLIDGNRFAVDVAGTQFLKGEENQIIIEPVEAYKEQVRTFFKYYASQQHRQGAQMVVGDFAEDFDEAYDQFTKGLDKLFNELKDKEALGDFWPPNNLNEDFAQTVDAEKVGGIDFNPDQIKMNIEGENAEALNLPGLQESVSLSGLTPVIYSITPITNLAVFFNQ